MMSRSVHVLIATCFAGLVAITLAASGQDYACQFEAPPERVVSEQETPVSVRFQTPAGKPTELRFEIKGLNGYHVMDVSTVEGSGIHVFDARIPAISECRQIQFLCWMGIDWQAPVNGKIVEAPFTRIITRHHAERLERQRNEVAAMAPADAGTNGIVGLYVGPGSAWGAPFAQHLAARIGRTGADVRMLQPGDLDNPFMVLPSVVDALILVDAQTVPEGAADALQNYVNAGGKLVVLGGRPFTRMLYPLGQQWLPADAYRSAMVKQMSPRPLMTFDDEQTTWIRGSNNAKAASSARSEPPGSKGTGRALALDIRDLSGWDTFEADFPSDQTIESDAWLTFRARGDGRTHQLSIELREHDGSRWIAVVSLSDQWQDFALPPEAFKYWRDNSATNRGGTADRVSLARAAAVCVGLAFTHTTGVGDGDHRIWIDDLGWAPAPTEDVAADAFDTVAVRAPTIETVAPDYKTFEVTHTVVVRPNPVQALVPGINARGLHTMSPVARPQGTGFGKERRWRFVPLLECDDANGRTCGAAASLCLSSRTEGGGMAAAVGVLDPGFYSTAIADWATELTARLRQGVFLYEAGATYYASFGNEAMPVGAIITNRGREAATFSVRMRVEDATGATIWRHEWSGDVAPGADQKVSADWPITDAQTAPYTVTTELLQDTRVADRLQHQVTLWEPAPAPIFMTRREGSFYLGDTPWYAHGVNYMPSSGIGIEDNPYFEYWFDPQPYDPDIIERDLEDVEAIGFNMVSVFQYRRSMTSRNLLDFLTRCRRHNLKVNLSLRPGTPMNFRWDDMREMIAFGKLAEDDTIMSYDLAWEPNWGGQAQRLQYDALWEAWVLETYGTIAAAEEAWGHPIPRGATGTVTNPSNEQTGEEGPWRDMVNAYYRFLNGLLNERYGRARELVRSVDAHHLVSFRKSMACDPTRDTHSLTYDFVGLKEAVDILEPEAYGRIGDWEHVKPGWFTAAYGRCVAPELPVLWAEFGYTVWDNSLHRPSPGRLAFAEQFYDDFYTMAYRSGANGTVCWWFPGGYRWNEHSDYGIINPDRSWRAVTKVINGWHKKMTAPRGVPAPETIIRFDRSATNRQIPGIYEQTKEAFWKAVDAGKMPGLAEEPTPAP